MHFDADFVFSEDGTLKGVDCDLLLDAGAYLGNSLNYARTVAHKLFRGYKYPYCRFHSRVALTNTIIGGAFRGWTSPEATIMFEHNMNMAARKLKMDPVDLRIKNVMHPGDEDPLIDTPIGNFKAEEALREAGLLASELHLFNKKSYSQAGEDAILMYIFVMLGVPLSQCTYLDLGANHPCDMSNTWFFYQQGARGILVDANPKLAEELRQARPEDRVLNACVGPVSGETLDFHVLSADGLSAPGDVSEVLRENPPVRVLGTIPMQTVAVNDLMEQLGGAPKILNLDIEGMEMEILRSIDFDKYRPTAMIIEMIPYSKQLVAGQKNQEILRFMQEKGYVEYAFTGINSIFLDMKFYEEILYPLWKNYRDDKITVEEFSKQLSNKTDIYLQEL